MEIYITGMKQHYHGLSIFNNMEARYRKDYPGEFVITESKWSGGKKHEKREWIANPIINQHLSGRAVAIGSSDDIARLDYRVLATHRGGLLGSLKVQTYGTAEIATQMRLDFTVDTDFNKLMPLVESKYTEKNIVYTTAKNCTKKPGEFYLIPQHPHMCPEVLPIYLAAFDGHNEVYLIGYSKEMTAGHDNWVKQITDVIKAYAGTMFIMVGNEFNMPDEWLSCSNTKTLTNRDFVTYCDV
jgi:hypothetical protein